MLAAHSAPQSPAAPRGAHSIDCPYCNGSGEVATAQSADGAIHDKPCPNCSGTGTLLAPFPLGESCTRCHGWGWAGGAAGRCPVCLGLGKREASPEATDVAARRMTRREYRETREIAHARLADANLLRHADPDEAKRLTAFARRLLADIAAPIDNAEGARNARWERLRGALALAWASTVMRDRARRAARELAA